MIITNHSGLPQALVRAVENDDYTRGKADISVTGLLKPPRMVALERRHASELTEDVSDRIWALFGKCAHKILEESGTGFKEHRLFTTCLGWVVSGQLDMMNDGRIEDWKITSSWSVKEGYKPEWEHQLNLYALLARSHGLAVNGLRIITILRDWSKLEARRNEDYPRSNCQVFDIPLWPEDKAQAYLEERVRLHQAAQTELPACSKEDRWAKDTTWAVMKHGAKRASKVFTEPLGAQRMASEKGPEYMVDMRPGENTRCQSYCAAAPYCEQWKELQNT